MAEYRRMHTVPQGYLSAFADRSVAKKKPHVWRYERGGSSSPKLLPVKDLCFVDDIYAVRGAAGTRDPVIERDLLGPIDSDFCSARTKIVEGALTDAAVDDLGAWKALSIFVAFQLTRTPRAFEILKDHLKYKEVPFATEDLPKLMVYSSTFLDHWLWLMQWELWRITGDDLLVTSDNPAVNWVDLGHGARLGAGFADPKLIVSLPITPSVSFIAKPTLESASHIAASTSTAWKAGQIAVPPVRLFEIEPKVVHKLNRVVVSHGERYAFSSYNDRRIIRFMSSTFTGTGLVRARDRQPIGS